jgi:DNA-directed RNA polymerase subunit RPC12/RpoP
MASKPEAWKCTKCWEDNVLAHGDGATDLACTFCGQIHKVEVQTVVTVTARSEPPHER